MPTATEVADIREIITRGSISLPIKQRTLKRTSIILHNLIHFALDPPFLRWGGKGKTKPEILTPAYHLSPSSFP